MALVFLVLLFLSQQNLTKTGKKKILMSPIIAIGYDSAKCVVKRALSVQGTDECVTQRVPGHKGMGATGAKWRAPNHSPLPWGSLRLPSPLHASLSSNKALHDDYPSMKT